MASPFHQGATPAANGARRNGNYDPSWNGFPWASGDPANMGATTATAPTSGNEEAWRVEPDGPLTIAKVSVYLNSAPTSLTAAYIAVKALDGTVLAQSANAAALFPGAAGLRDIPMAAPVTLSSAFYIAWLIVGITGTINFRGPSGSPGIINVNLAAPNLRSARLATAQAGPIAATANMALMATPSVNPPWLGIKSS